MELRHILMVTVLFSVITAAQEPPAEVIQVALQALRGGKPFFSVKCFESEKSRYGFQSSTKVSDLKIGDPFRQFRCSSEMNDTNFSFKSLEIMNYSWLCPVMENGQNMILMEVRNENGKWKVGGLFGANIIAYEWNFVCQAWPKSKGFHPVFVLGGFRAWFHVPEVDSLNLTHIRPVMYENGRRVENSSAIKYISLQYELSIFRKPILENDSIDNDKRVRYR